MNKPCKEAFEFPSYECYNEIKYQYVGKRLNISSRMKDFIQQHSHDIEQKFNGLSDLYNEFKKYLSNDHVFTSGEFNGQGTCKYISYLLCDQISKNQKGECDKGKFSIFNEFLEKYNKKTGSNICNGILKHLDQQEFLKVKGLFQLYELYDKLRLPNLYVDNPCQIFGEILANYNNALKTYDNEEGNYYNLIKKLLDYKDLTLKLTLPPENECPYKKRLFEEPNKYLTRLRDIETKKREAEEELLRKKQQEKQELERQKSQENEKHDTDESLRNGQDLSLEPLAQQNETEPSLGVVSLRGAEYIVEKPVSRPLSFIPERLRSQTELEQTEGRYPELKDKSMDTSTTSGIKGSITDTISRFIKEVEPGPVLGVSGGMGALFLLFKYTPVGSSFGGRRRRIHQIPSSFRGFPPGVFPIFQENDVGYIGYGAMNTSPFAE
ncbi:VIR protein [Plasmodium vivax]|uniref:VIR protein n=1 Tax=Plasmodium vivax TaxID=5855 RepID=A0A1G4E9Y9_PLAVI|nr:hypothetical protein, conserved [Plasmodium vivax]SCA60259.1 VIR protein [Plasmodium vivax]